MAYTTFDNYSGAHNQEEQPSTNNEQRISLNNDGQQQVDLPDNSYVGDADIIRDDNDLILETESGTIIIEGYFTAETAPNLVAPDGSTLTPSLINSFVHGNDNEYADASLSMSDVSPIGAIQEINGEVTVTRLDGTVEIVSIGTPIYQGDIIDTEDSSSVNIMFVDETTFAISEDARLAIDEYVFDASSQSGTSNFSMLKGVFVFTSGLIGRDDPDDVMINTPSGSIGIRGTIIAGNVDNGEITVIEGAIVLHDLHGNEVTLANQYETAKFNTGSSSIDHMGELAANDVYAKFSSVADVSGELFSSLQDSAEESSETQSETEQQETEESGKEESDGEDGTESQEEIITSDDILGSSEQSTAQPESNAEPTDLQETTSEQIQTQAQENIMPPPIEDQAPPQFHVEVTKFNFLENDASGVNVMHLKGEFTNHTNLQLVGTSNNYYEIVRNGGNDFTIKLQAGVAMDAERPYKLVLQSSNETGAINQIHNVNLNVMNVNEPTVLTNAMPDSFFSGTDSSHFKYNFSNEFFDVDGDIESYNFSGFTGNTGIISGESFNNGILNFDLNGITADQTGAFSFTIDALKNDGTTLNSQTYNFDIYNNTSSSAAVGTDKTYIGDDLNIFTTGDNASIFTNGNNPNDITISGYNNLVKSGGGNDTITVTTGTFYSNVYTESGNDVFNMHEVKGHFYGGDGSDKFHLLDTSTTSGAAGLQTLSPSQSILDGGNGYDLLHLGTAGNIDFSSISNGIIKNIEKIAFINSQANIINLDYNSVIDMTDNDNILTIDMDSNDTLNFTNTSGNDFYKVGEDINGSDHYDIYSDGTITLLIDTDHAAVSGI